MPEDLSSSPPSPSGLGDPVALLMQGADRAMAYDALSLSKAFSSRTLWKGAKRFQITPVKVLQRTRDFSILEVTDCSGVWMNPKVP